MQRIHAATPLQACVQHARGGSSPRAGESSDCATYPPANGCQPISWFGWATTAWHDGAGKQLTTGHAHYWFGSHAVGCGMRSGQMYMRNRYYDPQTGQFTQTDPIGLAGGLNSYGFAAGDPVGYSDPYGLRAEDIILQLVWTGPGSYHTSIRITPSAGSRYASDPRFTNGSLTLGAGPGGGPGPVGAVRTWAGVERLQSDVNRPGDVGRQTATFTLDPGAQGEDAAIARLLEADANYQDNLRYEFYPDGGFMSRLLGDSYNSNSYTAGMLNAAGISTPGCSGSVCHGYYVPGFEKPVPESELR